MSGAGLTVALAASAVLAAAPALAAGGFDRWAAVVVSGDDRAAHADVPTQAFDNARRDVAKGLITRGFAAGNLAQFSVEPARHPDTRPGLAALPAISATLSHLAAQAPEGCLFYLTSHGSLHGAILGEGELKPPTLARALAEACGGRPTIVVISACFSGVFVKPLAAPDRLVVTAARRDRSSFGCSENDRYPFFDGCVLEVLPASPDFTALAERTRVCVARREHEERMRPPSEPQISVGARFRSPNFAG